MPRPPTCDVGLPPLLGQAKVAELALRHLVAHAYEDVCALEVKVDDVLAVQVAHALVWGGGVERRVQAGKEPGQVAEQVCWPCR